MEATSVIKREAKEKLRGNWSSAIFVCLILAAVPFVFNIISEAVQKSVLGDATLYNYTLLWMQNQVTFGAFFNVFLTTVLIGLINTAADVAVMTLVISRAAFFLKMAEGKNPTVKDFTGEKRYFESFRLQLLMSVKIFLWTLLFVIPGIVKAFSYALAPFLKVKNPEQRANDCIKESCRLMKGYKMSLFVLMLSFIGWYLLVGVAMVIIGILPVVGWLLSVVVNYAAGLLLNVYVFTSVAVFYKEMTFPYLGEKYRRALLNGTPVQRETQKDVFKGENGNNGGTADVRRDDVFGDTYAEQKDDANGISRNGGDAGQGAEGVTSDEPKK